MPADPVLILTKALSATDRSEDRALKKGNTAGIERANSRRKMLLNQRDKTLPTTIAGAAVQIESALALLSDEPFQHTAKIRGELGAALLRFKRWQPLPGDGKLLEAVAALLTAGACGEAGYHAAPILRLAAQVTATSGQAAKAA